MVLEVILVVLGMVLVVLGVVLVVLGGSRLSFLIKRFLIKGHKVSVHKKKCQKIIPVR